MQGPEVAVQEDWLARAAEEVKKQGRESLIVGKTGELAVLHWLQSQGIPAREDHPVGRADYFDLLVRGTTIEIKTTTKGEIKVPKDTFDRGRRFGFYIGVKLSLPQKRAWICGYAKKEDVRQGKVIRIEGKAYYALSLAALKPVEQLLPYLRGEW
ncbi:MAG: DUF1822 family protein [Candidatus Aenigmarchaeota archaeon]|nr:DUF1822 family protein [Candidatus Aenigmarchaeota archaeon]